MKPDEGKEAALKLINAMLTKDKAENEQELLVLRSLLDPADEEELAVMLEAVVPLIKYQTMRVLKHFNTVRKRVLTDHRRACDKCGKKCRYFAVVNDEKICYECYEEYRKACGRG